MLTKPQGANALMAENILLRKQLIQLSRKHKRSPKLSFFDRLILAILAHLINPSRLIKSAILIKPTTIIKFHKALIKRKYNLLFSSKSMKKPGPKEAIERINPVNIRNEKAKSAFWLHANRHANKKYF